MPQLSSTQLSLLAALQQASAGLSLAQLIAALPQVSPDAVAEALDKCLMAERVTLGYSPDATNYSHLVFYAPEHRPLAVARSHAVSCLVNTLQHNTDGRGDFDPTMAPAALVDKLASKFTSEEVMAAIQHGVREDLFRFMSRASNMYITISLSTVHSFTVFATDISACKLYCFQVRAGSKTVARAKVEQYLEGFEAMVHGFVEGSVALRPFTDQDYLEKVSL